MNALFCGRRAAALERVRRGNEIEPPCYWRGATHAILLWVLAQGDPEALGVLRRHPPDVLRLAAT